MEMPTKNIELCFLCHTKGKVLYKDLIDTLFGVTGSWSLSQCKRCSLLWLNPRPYDEHVSLLYENYYTHEGLTNEFLLGSNVSFDDFPRNKKIKYAVLERYFGYQGKISPLYKIFGQVLGGFSFFRKKVEASIGGFRFVKSAKVLDIGCGNGDYLLEMKYLGFEVEGIEVDPRAAEIARNCGLQVITGVLKEDTYEKNSFDAIYMNNVIEHLSNPEEIMRICHAILKKGGRLCVKTCSSESLAHSYFKESYRGLEIPRHFFIFSPRSLQELGRKTGFSVKKKYTLFNGYIWAASRAIQRGDKNAAYAVERKMILFFQKIVISAVLFVLPERGDDIFILFEKK